MSLVSNAAAFLKDKTNPAVFDTLKKIYQLVARPSKTTGELSFWMMQYEREGGTLHHDHYEAIMTAMAQPLHPKAFAGRVVADFGCGPRGSLTWLTQHAHCIGIDVLVPQYLQAFPQVMRSNRMTYIASTETHIPLQDDTVDVLFTMNALDHVVDLQTICDEIRRILKPGGHLIGAFNLDEAPTVTEPQTLTEAGLATVLLDHFDPLSRRTAPIFSDDPYAGFFGQTAPPGHTGPRMLWFVGQLL